MTKVQKTALTVSILVVLQFAANANASTFMKCKDKTLATCEEITKGQAVKEQAVDSKTIILKVDQVELSDKGTLKAKSN